LEVIPNKQENSLLQDRSMKMQRKGCQVSSRLHRVYTWAHGACVMRSLSCSQHN